MRCFDVRIIAFAVVITAIKSAAAQAPIPLVDIKSVDATLVDAWNRPVRMPTDFDDFTPAAMWQYLGSDLAVRSHLHLLQGTMRDAGFYGLRTEWWHFTIADLQKYLPPETAKRAAEVFGTHWQGKL